MKGENYIHKKANIEGNVKLGLNVSVWAFASLRGDEGQIVVGDNSNIQENAVIHGKTIIGRNVTVAHGAIIHGAKIGNNVLIGINSTILDGVEIADWNIIAAGSVVTPNAIIDEGNLIIGVPGKAIRALNEKDKQLIREAYENYLNK
ncbi:MAG TPA: gamma carbonic anhydrase family protein [Candidatus Paceibacterota bacterium]|nr:gamma carbonic anhydrase family protein [Candidatus Paceibacterota bacterium]